MHYFKRDYDNILKFDKVYQIWGFAVVMMLKADLHNHATEVIDSHKNNSHWIVGGAFMGVNNPYNIQMEAIGWLGRLALYVDILVTYIRGQLYYGWWWPYHRVQCSMI